MQREIQHFIAELAEYQQRQTGYSQTMAFILAEGMVTLVFSSGAEALDMSEPERAQLAERLICQLRMIVTGAALMQAESPAP